MAAYIDLNPVRAGICELPEDYRWSSYGEAVGGGRGAGIARAGLVRALHGHEGREGTSRAWAQGGVAKVIYEADKKIERSLRRRAEGPLPNYKLLSRPVIFWLKRPASLRSGQLLERAGLSRLQLPWLFDCGLALPCGCPAGVSISASLRFTTSVVRRRTS